MAPGKNSVRQMFEEIAPRYDFLNHFLSLGTDRSWRRRLVGEVRRCGALQILDIATGTGDLALALSRIHGTHITGVDISPAMLEIGRAKVSKAGLSNQIDLQVADGEQLPFPDESFDAVTIAFGVRNYEHLDQGLREMFRVIRPGGRVFILEFSKPVVFPVAQFYRLYSKMVIPLAGRLISKHPTAYNYLPDTIAAFPHGEAFLARLQSAGFSNGAQITLTGGISSVYHAVK